MKKSIVAQQEITKKGKLLDMKGNLAQTGWSRQPVLDCNLEETHIEKTAAFWQPMRIKVWDYYGFTTPTHFVSFTVSNVGYIASIFAYVIDFKTGKYTEQTLTVPLAKGAHLPRNSDEGETCFDNGKVHLHFSVKKKLRTVSARWKDFLPGKPLNAEIEMKLPSRHESMNIVIPIKGRRFYFNRKINCIPASGWVEYAGKKIHWIPKLHWAISTGVAGFGNTNPSGSGQAPADSSRQAHHRAQPGIRIWRYQRCDRKLLHPGWPRPQAW